MKLKIYDVFSGGLLLLSSLMFVAGLFSALKSLCVIVEWELWCFNCSLFSMSLLFDWMSLLFLGSVCLISGSIMNYCNYYMEGELNYSRFTYILMMFVVSMWLLIISPNLISLLIGWDGLGLTSYALVIFYQNESSCNAGMLTVLSNRIGDVALLLSIGLMFSSGSWDFFNASFNGESLLVGLIMLASATKSAQIPFSAWLPAAMAAPTPVSSLVHSSTLVTAGVYLLIRFSVMISESGLSKIILVLSVTTMVMAGLGAMFESDMKKVVALSTLSQLGLMIMILSGGMKELAFFHLIAHAMFKSTLFLCAGFMIHSVGGYQDSRVMSGFTVSSPVLGVVLSGTNLALCGFPFLAGFYSKDASLEFMFSSSTNMFLYLMIILGTGLTVAYSFRVLYLSASKISASKSVSSLSDADYTVVFSVSVLFLATLVSGFFMYWSVVPTSRALVLGDLSKFSVVGVSLIGGLSMYSYLQKSHAFKGEVVKVLENAVSLMWFLPFLSTKPASKVFCEAGMSGIKSMDSGWLELYGGKGGRVSLLSLSGSMQGGQGFALVNSYMVSGLLGFCVLFLVI